MILYPDQLPITPSTHPVDATVTVPGSKSITNRALVLAALASRNGPCVLEGVLQSEDTEVMVDCLTRLGFELHVDWPACHITVNPNPSGRIIPAKNADLFVGNSGTTIRFITAMVALGHGTYRLDGIPRMRERPIQDLLDTLQQLGVAATSETANGCPPVVVTAHGLRGGAVKVKANISSQFLSGLLLAAPFATAETTLEIVGNLVSEPYVEMTIAMLKAFHLTVNRDAAGRFVIPGNQQIRREQYAIEPDASSASYFWAMAAITGGRITVNGLTRTSLQGDVHFLDILQQMGCRVEEADDAMTVHGGSLQGFDVDMNAISDTVMTLAAVACFADGPTRIRNVAHIRHKETDRIAALATELRKLGAVVDEYEDGLQITPRPLMGCAVDTYNDHRMAMSLALIGLRIPGVAVNNPGCVAKTYPGFWQDLEKAQ